MTQSNDQEKNICLNCGYKVEKKFCTACGQENRINRPSFVYLFKQLFKALFLLDPKLFRTMKNLLFRPGKIIADYLDGKRSSYVDPVRLYFFSSFVTFLLPFLLPELGASKVEKPAIETEKIDVPFLGFNIQNHNIQSIAQLDSLQSHSPKENRLSIAEYSAYRAAIKAFKNPKEVIPDSLKAAENHHENDLDVKLKIGLNIHDDLIVGPYEKATTLAQFDSIHNSLSTNEQYGFIEAAIARKYIDLYEKVQTDDPKKIQDQYTDVFNKYVPKALLFYLPFFALFLWLIHGKKKWKYYDHGIFTLYFFAFLLVLTGLNILFNWLIYLPSDFNPKLITLSNLMGGSVTLLSFGYAFFYFFRAHRLVYQEKKLISRLKSFVLVGVNCFFFIVLFVIYIIVAAFFVG